MTGQVGVVLRPGNAPASRGTLGILRRLLVKLRKAFPKTRLRVRLDGGFATPEIFYLLEDQQVEYLVAMPKNKRLEPRGKRLLAKARRRTKQTGQTAHFYGETRYAAMEARQAAGDLQGGGGMPRQVLCWRFGLTNERDYTLQEIGTRLGLTRERIRQIEAVALRKLRKLVDVDALGDGVWPEDRNDSEPVRLEFNEHVSSSRSAQSILADHEEPDSVALRGNAS